MCTTRHAHTIFQLLGLATTVTCPTVALAAPYELRVYSDDIPNQGASEIELIMSVAKPKPTDDGPRGHVFQTLVEYGYGLGNGWSVGLQLPMSQVDGQRKLNGLKIEAHYVAKRSADRGPYWGVRSDVGYTSSPYEAQGSHSLDINPIFGYRWATWHLVLNPSIEIPLSGPNTKTQFQPSAKIANSVNNTSQWGLEYFSSWGALHSLHPQRQRDETLYVVWDKSLTHSRWSFGLGQPLNPSGGSVDKWVVKLGLTLDVD
jgi:hypothetical protein